MKKIFVTALTVAFVLFIGLNLMLATFAKGFVERYRHDIAGLAIELKDIDINWFSLGVTLKEVNIYPANKENSRYLLASAEKIKLNLALLDFLWKTVHIRSLKLTKPNVNYIRTSMRHTNWEALNMSWLKADEKKKGDMGGWGLKVDKLIIDEGRFLFEDRVTGGRFDLRKMDASVSSIVEEPDLSELPSKVKVDGVLSKYDSPVRLRGKMNVLAEGLNFKFKSHIKNAPITYFAPFYAGQVPFRVVGGTISIESDMKSLKSYLRSTHNAAVRGLRVGGVKGKLINPLFLKNKVIYATAVVNGDLEKGDLRVSSQVSRIIGNSILADAKKAAPLNSVGTGVEKARGKVGEAVDRLFKRRR